MPDTNALDACKIAANLLAEGCVVLDTETTGLTSTDQIVEIAVIGSDGNVIIDQRLCPTVAINPKAEAVHGISLDDLQLCPQWPEVIDSIKAALMGKTIAIYNANFDLGMLRSTCKAFGGDSWIDSLNTVCAMNLAVQVFGSTNRHGTISLANATHRAGVAWTGDAHSASSDAQATLDLLRAIATYRNDIR